MIAAPKPFAAPSLSVEAAAAFPVRRIYCVGRNYADHAREMGSDPDREPPFFFTKPSDAVHHAPGRVAYPPSTSDFHYEVELVVALGGGGRNLTPDAAEALVYGQAVGVDLTRRDLQADAKAHGRPWDLSKGFDQSAPCGLIRPLGSKGVLRSGAIRLSVNGTVRQDSDLSKLIWSVGEILANLSTFVRLEAGDLVFTGTPAGVGPLAVGDRIAAEIEGLPPLALEIAPPLQD